MNTSPLTKPRKANQAGAILPVVLLLGIGLMTGVAGVVNLGFVQEDLARAERQAIDSAIANQYLIDYQQIRISQSSASDPNSGQANGAQLPFPVAASTLGSFSNATDSCFYRGDGFYRRERGGYETGTLTDYDIGDIRPVQVELELEPDPGASGEWLLAGKADSYQSPAYFSEYIGPRLHAIRLGSGTDRIELRRLGETDVDRFYAHFWVRMQVASSGPSEAPLLTYRDTMNNPLGTPEIQLKFITQASGADVTYSIQPIVNSSALASVSSEESRVYDFVSVHLWLDAPNNQLWYRVKTRGNNAGEDNFVSTIPIPGLNRNSEWVIGHVQNAAASGPVVVDADRPFEVASVRVWLEPPFNSASAAEDFADSLIMMDTRRPGGEFVSSGVVAPLSEAVGEPDSYITLNSDTSLVTLGPGNGSLVASDWQPLFGQPIVFGSATEQIMVGGNPDSLNDIERGGPPASEHVYVFHACDENGYRFVQRIRRYTRGAGATDQQVEWIEE